MRRAPPDRMFVREKLPLFAMARKTDPVTSHEAAEKHEASGKAQANRTVALNLVKRFPGLTAVELSDCGRAVGLVLGRYEASRRLPEIEKEGLVYKGNVRRCTINETPMHEWWPVKNV